MPSSSDTDAQRHLVSIDEAAAYLGVDPRTIRKMIDHGHLRAYKIAGTALWRLERADVEAALTPMPRGKGASS